MSMMPLNIKEDIVEAKQKGHAMRDAGGSVVLKRSVYVSVRVCMCAARVW